MARARELQAMHMYNEDGMDALPNAGPSIGARLAGAFGTVVEFIDDARQAREQARQDAAKEQDEMGHLFAANQTQMSRDLRQSEMHFG